MADIRTIVPIATSSVGTNKFMNHKQRMKLPKKGVKTRKSWGNLNPVTKVVESEKKYNRTKEKKQVRLDFECEG